MLEKSEEPKQIDNWRIEQVYLDDTMTFSAPVIQGFVGGKKVKSDILLWFDLENKVAMTKDEIFKIGNPNSLWMGHYLASGHDPEDLEIKDTTH